MGCGGLYDFVWNITRKSKVIQIYFESNLNRSQCPGFAVGYIYNTTISNISVGTHTVKIIHYADGLTPGFEMIEDIVFTQEFVIE